MNMYDNAENKEEMIVLLAVFPVLYFMCAAFWVHNYVALILMGIFGVVHNIVSYISLYK